jgi:hypothetical protein
MCLRGGESELAAMRVRAAGEQARQAHKVAGLTRRVGYRASAGYRDPLRDIASRRDIPHTNARYPASAGYRNSQGTTAMSRCSTISHERHTAISCHGRISRPNAAISRRGGMSYHLSAISHLGAISQPDRRDIAPRRDIPLASGTSRSGRISQPSARYPG